jgi:hypothetical protein
MRGGRGRGGFAEFAAGSALPRMTGSSEGRRVGVDIEALAQA